MINVAYIKINECKVSQSVIVIIFAKLLRQYYRAHKMLL